MAGCGPPKRDEIIDCAVLGLGIMGGRECFFVPFFVYKVV